MSDAAFRIKDSYGSIILQIDSEKLAIKIGDDYERQMSIETGRRLEAALGLLLGFVDAEEADDDGEE